MPTVSRDNYAALLKKEPYTVIEVFSRKCPGCRRIEPLLPGLGARIKEQRGQLVRMNVLNEVSFLKNVDKTPSFLVYSRKKGTFTPLGKVEGSPDASD